MEHTAAISSVLTPLLLAVIGVLVAVLIWLGKRMHEKIDALTVHRESCLRYFVDRNSNAADHEEFYKRTNDHETRLTLLESQRGLRGVERS